MAPNDTTVPPTENNSKEENENKVENKPEEENKNKKEETADSDDEYAQATGYDMSGVSKALEELIKNSTTNQEILAHLAIITNKQSIRGVPNVILKHEEYLPTFSGEPDEEPEYFITKLEEFFDAPHNRNLPEEILVKVATKQLRGPAAKMYRPFVQRDKTLKAVQQRLLNEYGTEKNFTSLYTRFQDGKQGREESVEAFFARQQALYQRLFPGAPETRLIDELVKQVPREWRMYLAPITFTTVADLTLAMKKLMAIPKNTQKPENWRRTETTSSPRSASAE